MLGKRPLSLWDDLKAVVDKGLIVEPGTSPSDPIIGESSASLRNAPRTGQMSSSGTIGTAVNNAIDVLVFWNHNLHCRRGRDLCYNSVLGGG